MKIVVAEAKSRLCGKNCKLKIILVCLMGYLFIGLLATHTPAAASETNSSCQPIYGGGETCIQTGKITINKTVQNPKSFQYVENLTSDDPKYNPGQIVRFQITVTNTSNASVKNIEVKDLLPQYIENATKIITFHIDNLNANEAKIFTLKKKIASKSNLPGDKETICLINQAIVTQMQQYSQDNSQFCIQKNEVSSSSTQPINPNSTKGGLPVYPPSKTKATPATGPEAVAVFGLIASGLLGFMLRKKR